MKHKQNPWPSSLGSAAEPARFACSPADAALARREKSAYGAPVGDVLGPVGGGKGYCEGRCQARLRGPSWPSN